MRRIEEMISEQQAELRGLEDLVRRIMHKNRISERSMGQDKSSTSPESPKPRRMSLFQDDPADTGRPQRLRRLSAPFVRRRSR
jgi:hypothetical protein